VVGGAGRWDARAVPALAPSHWFQILMPIALIQLGAEPGEHLLLLQLALAAVRPQAICCYELDLVATHGEDRVPLRLVPGAYCESSVL
jgi:hypothetical protein